MESFPGSYSHLTPAQLKAEIEKCVHCAEKPCMEACPSHCSPMDFILAARNQAPSDLRRAALEILKANPLGEICGIVCPDTFCMDACTRKTFDRPVEIPKIQAAIVRHARDLKTMETPERPTLNGRRVAVIGGGPAGLAATALLARKGYEVGLYDESKQLGGACLMIPESRLPRKALRDDIDFILKMGAVKTFLGKKVESAEPLLKAYDGVVVAVGEPEATLLGIPGEKLAVSSIRYLKAPKKFKAKRVAIIGGGAVAVDCAVTARQQGAEAVELFVRRTHADMPLTECERRMLLDYRIDVTTRTRPQAIARAGKKFTLTTTKVEPAPSRDGKVKLVDIPKTSVKRPGFDVVILAIGTEWKGERSKNPAVFHAGDCVEGSSTVVQAAAAGKNAARELDLFLSRAAAAEKAALKASRRPGSRSAIKSREVLDGLTKLPVDLRTDFFGIPIANPFLLSAAPATDGLEQMKRAYEAGWAGGVMKTAFDNLPIHIPGEYMVTFGSDKTTHGNSDNVSGHPLDRVCQEVAELRRLYPDRLTMASTGGPVTGNHEADAKVWQSNTLKLERAGAMAVEYSLSCPQGGDGTEGDIVSQNAVVTARVIDWVMQVSDPSIPKLFKLTAAVTSIKPIIKAVKEVFARYPHKKGGVTLANSFPVLAFRPRAGEGRWDEGMVVGMSGEGVVPISYLTLSEVSSFGVAVSGNGGVMDYRSAANFLALGAQSVQVCTVVTRHGLPIIDELTSGLSHFMHDRGFKSVSDLIGAALPKPVTPFPELSAVKKISSVRKALCESCGNCTRCPYLAISLDKKGHPVIDPARCVGCSICVQQCFAGALAMRDRTEKEHALLAE
ncbi:MAG: FAD-dependent oxidoreductase [Oligoflexia bacterium]|nr:FAD-dependent oxidoreductase [Oligoflexia bacterium]